MALPAGGRENTGQVGPPVSGEGRAAPWPRAKVIAFIRRLEAEAYSPGNVRHISGIVKRVLTERASARRRGRGAPPASPPRKCCDPPSCWRRWEAGGQGQGGAARPGRLPGLLHGVRDAAPGDLPRGAGGRRLPGREDTGEDGEGRRPQGAPPAGRDSPVAQAQRLLHAVHPDDLHSMWRAVEREAGAERRELQGWQSVRRALSSYLPDTARLPLQVVYSFLRWRTPAALMAAMPYPYRIKSPEEVDREVFAVHPFLPMWGEAV